MTFTPINQQTNMAMATTITTFTTIPVPTTLVKMPVVTTAPNHPPPFTKHLPPFTKRSAMAIRGEDDHDGDDDYPYSAFALPCSLQREDLAQGITAPGCVCGSTTLPPLTVTTSVAADEASSCAYSDLTATAGPFRRGGSSST